MLNKYLVSLKKKKPKKQKPENKAECWVIHPKKPEGGDYKQLEPASWAPLEKPEEKQEGTGFRKEKENWSREVILEDRAQPDRTG